MPKKRKDSGNLAFLIVAIIAFWLIVGFAIVNDWNKDMKWTVFIILSALLMIMVITGITTKEKIKKILRKRLS